MSYKAIPVAQCNAHPTLQFTPAPDQSHVSHMRISIQAIHPLPDGSLGLSVVSGDLGFKVRIPATPNRPQFIVGKRYYLEQAKGANPFLAPYTAIYPEHLKPAPHERNSSMNTPVPNHINAATIPAETLTMTSVEIAEVVEARHDSVKRTIERLAERGTIAQPPTVDMQKTSGNNRKYSTTVYKIGKRDSYIVVAQLSPEFTARLVDRWQELEQQIANPQPAIPQTLPEALRLAATLAEEKQQLKLEVEELEPQAQALQRISEADGEKNITVSAKTLQVRPKDLFAHLRQHKWIYRRAGGSNNIAYQDKIQSGLLTHKITTIKRDDGTEKVIEQVLITPKGLAKLAKVFAKETV